MGCCVKSNWDTNSCAWNKNDGWIFFRERFTTKIFKGLGWSNANLRLIYFTLKSNALSKERFFGLWTPEWRQSGSGIKRGRKETMVIPHHYIPTPLHCLLSNAQKTQYISSHPCFILLSPLSVLGELIELMAKKHSTVSWGQKGMGEEEAGRACLKWKKNLQTIKK